MERTWSTERPAGRAQFTHWRDAVSEAFAFVEGTWEDDSERGSPGRVSARHSGGLRVARIASGTPARDHMTTMVTERPGDTAVLSLPLGDRPSAGRSPRTSSLSRGEFAIVDSARPLPRGFTRPRRSSRAALTDEALGHMEAMLGDPTLTPRAVAQRIAVSPRQLHRMFADRGTTFGRALLERRLARGHAMLRDPAQADRPIGEIAHEIGFADPSYFARAFRIRYGMAPREARRAAR